MILLNTKSNTDDTGQNSIFGTWILMIPLKSQYIEIRHWIYWFCFHSFSCGIGLSPIIRSIRLGNYCWIHIWRDVVFVCFSFIASLVQQTTTRIDGYGRYAKCAERSEKTTNSVHTLICFPLFAIAYFLSDSYFFMFCLFLF